MGRGLTAGHQTIVTADTGADDFLVIDPGGRNLYPRCRRTVTRIAGVAAGDMGGAFACRGHTVMTGDTRANDLGVIHRQ